MFLIFRFTNLTKYIYDTIPKGVGWNEAMVVGLEVGVSIGIVLAPLLLVSNKLFPVKD